MTIVYVDDCDKVTINHREFPVVSATLFDFSGCHWMILTIAADFIDDSFFDYCAGQKILGTDLRVALVKADGTYVDGDSVFHHCTYDTKSRGLGSILNQKLAYQITIDYKVPVPKANDISLISL